MEINAACIEEYLKQCGRIVKSHEFYDYCGNLLDTNFSSISICAPNDNYPGYAYHRTVIRKNNYCSNKRYSVTKRLSHYSLILYNDQNISVMDEFYSSIGNIRQRYSPIIADHYYNCHHYELASEQDRKGKHYIPFRCDDFALKFHLDKNYTNKCKIVCTTPGYYLGKKPVCPTTQLQSTTSIAPSTTTTEEIITTTQQPPTTTTQLLNATLGALSTTTTAVVTALGVDNQTNSSRYITDYNNDSFIESNSSIYLTYDNDSFIGNSSYNSTSTSNGGLSMLGLLSLAGVCLAAAFLIKKFLCTTRRSSRFDGAEPVPVPTYVHNKSPRHLLSNSEPEELRHVATQHA